MFHVGDEPEVETIGYRSDRKSANEPASIADESAFAAASPLDDGGTFTVHVSDVPNVAAQRDATPIEYRSAAGSSPSRHAGEGDSRAASSPQLDEDHAAAFDQLMAEARRHGTLSATEEMAFRNDLAAMPAHLRPQMAAMLLAVRGRRADPSSSTNGASGMGALHSLDVSPTRSSLDATQTTADRLAKIASPTGAHDALSDNRLSDNGFANNGLADNPLRALASSSLHSAGRTTASNSPAELAPAASHASSLTAWPSSPAAASFDRARGERDIRTALHREAAAAGQTPHDSPSEEWQVMLGATIRSLEGKLAGAAEGDDKVRREALLRLLYLVADRLNDAARPVSADKGEQQFWVDWLYGTSVYLDNATTPHDGQRAAVAADRLREAVNQLGAKANLAIGNLTFCRRVTSFGVYEPFTAKESARATSQFVNRSPTYEFAANQEVLLYAEIQNFASLATEKGYHTLLRPSYQIFDSQGRRLGSVVELDESHDYCQRPRTDFFVCYHIYLPTRIDPGAYKLKLTIEDVHGRKVQENSVDFSIKGR